MLVTAAYAGPTNPPAPGRGEVAAYARHRDYHDLLAAPLKALATFCDQAAGPGTRSLWYVDTGPILERDLAQRAGLGFVGKHTNLVAPRMGNWLLLAEILSTACWPPDPPERNHCGRCRECLDACPTGALPAPFTLDARRCISYLTIELKGSIPAEFRPLMGAKVFGCDDCLAACPWNRFAAAGRLMREAERGDLTDLDLNEIVSMGETEFHARFSGTPMERTKLRGLRRNACVALGNIGGAGALPVLRAAAKDSDAMVAEHASWAIDRLQARLAALQGLPA